MTLSDFQQRFCVLLQTKNNTTLLPFLSDLLINMNKFTHLHETEAQHNISTYSNV